MTRITKKIDGILLLDKPLDITSNGILQRVKRLFGAKKAGHTGSLDPLATGMLPLCFGEATKLSQYLLESDKYYAVTAKLGVRTATGDAEGEVIATQTVTTTAAEIAHILKRFTGTITQIPPMYSALKFQGKPLYKLARQGIEVERQPRQVQIHDLFLENVSEDKVDLHVHCTKGTYIRTLIDDIGLALGCGAFVSGLRRTAVAPYQEAQMVSFAQLEEAAAREGPDALQRFLLPLESCVQIFPAVKLSTSAAFYMKTGQAVMVPHLPVQGLVRLFANEEFIGIGEILADGKVGPKRLLKQPQHTAASG